MSYAKNVWKSGDKVTSEKLNNIENGLETVSENTNVVYREFKEFKGVLPKDYIITLENVLDKTQNSLCYSFYANDGEYLSIYYDCHNEELHYELTDKYKKQTSGDVEEYKLPFEFTLDEISYDYNGEGLLGELTEIPLTAQEVYENSKLKNEVLYKKTITDAHSIAFGKLPNGLYELFLSCPNYYEYSAIFRIVNGITTGYINIVFEDEDEGEVNGSFRVKQGEYEDEGYYVLEFYAPITSDTRNLGVNTVVTIIKIL